MIWEDLKSKSILYLGDGSAIMTDHRRKCPDAAFYDHDPCPNNSVNRPETEVVSVSPKRTINGRSILTHDFMFTSIRANPMRPAVVSLPNPIYEKRD